MLFLLTDICQRGHSDEGLKEESTAETPISGNTSDLITTTNHFLAGMNRYHLSLKNTKKAEHLQLLNFYSQHNSRFLLDLKLHKTDCSSVTLTNIALKLTVVAAESH